MQCSVCWPVPLKVCSSCHQHTSSTQVPCSCCESHAACSAQCDSQDGVHGLERVAVQGGGSCQHSLLAISALWLNATVKSPPQRRYLFAPCHTLASCKCIDRCAHTPMMPCPQALLCLDWLKAVVLYTGAPARLVAGNAFRPATKSLKESFLPSPSHTLMNSSRSNSRSWVLANGMARQWCHA